MENQNEKRPKGQRILAMIGVVCLVALYIVTLISAVFTTPATKGLFMACIFSTVAIPVMLYGYILVYRALKSKNEDLNKWRGQRIGGN